MKRPEKEDGKHEVQAVRERNSRKGAIFNSFCSEQCSEEWYKDDNIAVTVICVKVPRIYKELRPRLGEMIHAVKRKSYNSTGYIFERAGKKVLLRADEVVEVAG